MNLTIKGWPKFLGIAVGYGADGMVGGDDNIWKDNNGNIINRTDITRYRQFYISPSFRFGYIKTKSLALKTLLWITDHVKIPSPAIEFGNRRIKMHWLYW
jgi:hypothetical protein